jgi:hypothetical protein
VPEAIFAIALLCIVCIFFTKEFKGDENNVSKNAGLYTSQTHDKPLSY